MVSLNIIKHLIASKRIGLDMNIGYDWKSVDQIELHRGVAFKMLFLRHKEREHA